jgi:hypothetical protein
MTSERPDDESLNDFSPEDEIDAVFGYGHPNAERAGCPPPEVLPLLARRKLPIEHPGYEHLGHCSPCYRRVRVLKAHHRRRLRRVGASVAALVIVGFIAVRYWYDGGAERDRQSKVGTGGSVAGEMVAMTIDLRPFTVMRSGDAAAGSPATMKLPRARLDLTIFLPIGSEPGEYELQLVDAASSIVASARTEAAILNFVTTCRSVLDLRHSNVGPHVLRIQRTGGEWREYSLSVN